MVQLQALRAFREVARSGSFTAAGRAVGLSTPSVSRLVNDLEADLGARLLVRTTRNIALTDAGRTFFERSAALLDELEYDQIVIPPLDPLGMLRFGRRPAGNKIS